MEGRSFWISASVGMLFLLMLLGTVLFFVTRQSDLSPGESVSALQECKTLSYHGKNAVNLVFFSDAALAQKYMDFLLEVKPLTDYSESFNVYYIDDYFPLCEHYQNIALFCHSSELTRRAASCPNDFTVVIKEDATSIRSSSYNRVMSINSRHPLSVFAHEFGHAFVALDEEYTPAYLSSHSQNCLASCEGFGEQADGCFKGCSKTDYHRSIENGVMRTLSSQTFGRWNEAIITDELEKTHREGGFSGRVIDEERDCSNEFYYLLEAQYSSQGISVLDKRLEVGCGGGAGSGQGRIEYYSASGERLAQKSINLDRVFTDAPPSQEGVLEIEGEVFTYEGTFSLAVPLSSGAREITLQDALGAPGVRVFLADADSRACRSSS